MTIEIYYWPFLVRGASLVRMLEHTKTPYKYISDKAQMATVCSAFGATSGDTFAPPVVKDGDYLVSQSVASCLYLGKKLGLTPPGYDDFKAIQYCSDIVDAFEGGVGKNNEDGAALKKYLTGERFKAQLSNLERAIQGPFYFGAEPSAVDFFLLQHMDWRDGSLFTPLKDRGLDALAPYPKVCGVHAALKATDAYKGYSGGLPLPGPIKDEILDAAAA